MNFNKKYLEYKNKYNKMKGGQIGGEAKFKIYLNYEDTQFNFLIPETLEDFKNKIEQIKKYARESKIFREYTKLRFSFYGHMDEQFFVGDRLINKKINELVSDESYDYIDLTINFTSIKLYLIDETKLAELKAFINSLDKKQTPSIIIPAHPAHREDIEHSYSFAVLKSLLEPGQIVANLKLITVTEQDRVYNINDDDLQNLFKHVSKITDSFTKNDLNIEITSQEEIKLIKINPTETYSKETLIELYKRSSDKLFAD